MNVWIWRMQEAVTEKEPPMAKIDDNQLQTMRATCDEFPGCPDLWSSLAVRELLDHIDDQAKQICELEAVVERVLRLSKQHERCGEYHCGPCEVKSHVTCKKIKLLIEAAETVGK